MNFRNVACYNIEFNSTVSLKCYTDLVKVTKVYDKGTRDMTTKLFFKDKVLYILLTSNKVNIYIYIY